MCEVGRTADRMSAVDFTRFTFIDQIIFLSQSPSIKKHDLILSDKISPRIQLISVACFCVIIGLLWNFAKIQKIPNWKFGSNAVKLYGIFLKQCMFLFKFEHCVLISYFFSNVPFSTKSNIINSNAFCHLDVCLSCHLKCVQFNILLNPNSARV